MKRWLGKYRGTVTGVGSVNEPAGSLMVNVPEVMGSTGSQLALPCFPFTGSTSGSFVLPPTRSAVWVEFEGGQETKPIWIGGFYPTPSAPSSVKSLPPGTESLVIQTTKQNVLSIADVNGPTGGILLRAANGASLELNDTGVTIKDGNGGVISMSNGTVSINSPNLVVLK